MPSSTDDIFARIAEHRRLVRRFEILAEMGEDQAADAAWGDKALDVLIWSFIDQPPTTVAGVAALLTYAEEYLADGRQWPDNRSYFDGGDDVPWEQALLRTAGSALQRLAQA